jgi:isocitrate dehydrogenase (NAD+)
VLRSIETTRTALKGPITTPVGTGFRSVNVALRQELDLFAAIRPSLGLPGVRARFADVDVVVIRENTEDLYAGIEFEVGSPELARLRRKLRVLADFKVRTDAGVTVKPISVWGTRRIVRFAFDHALRTGRSRVTVGHKANIMRFSDGIFLFTASAEAHSYPDISFEEMQVDELAMRLVTEPERFDLLLLPNLYGDILSDLCAGLVGGLGIAAGANLGWEYALFEPVHGSAPDIAGMGLANPTAIVLSAAMMLEHLGETSAAAGVRAAVRTVLADGRARTRDLGGTAGTEEMTVALCRVVEAGTATPGGVTVPTLETARLRLRPFVPGDAEAWRERVFGDPEVRRYLPPAADMPVERLREAIGRLEAHWERRGYGWWAVEERRTGRFLGHVGLRFVEEIGETEVLYALARDVWGRGLATEAAGAALRFGFERGGLQRIVAFAVAENRGSTRVMEKVGMHYEGEQHIFGLETLRYAISREAWESADGSA